MRVVFMAWSRPSIRVGPMDSWRWVLLSEGGDELRSTEGFATRGEAEEWLSGAWSSLADEGVAAVSLRSGDDEVYEMSLAPE